ncbi:hypothetical protein CR513_48140, partial [Mucuna pruriens]
MVLSLSSQECVRFTVSNTKLMFAASICKFGFIWSGAVSLMVFSIPIEVWKYVKDKVSFDSLSYLMRF